MNTLMVITFRDEAGVRQGLEALKTMQSEGSLALYGSAILVKDAAGQLSLQAVDKGPFGFRAGALLGALLGLPVGPLGFAMGAASGAVAGAIHEMSQEQRGAAFVQQVAGLVPPGGGAVVAEVAEFGETPLEARLRALGGLVLRDTHLEVEYQAAFQDLAEIRAEIGDAWAEYEMAVAEAAARRDKHLAAARARLAEKAERLKLFEAYMQRQTDARIAHLQQQAEQADPEQRADLDGQIARIRADHNQRRARVEEALSLTQAALAR
jgi:uncharacterized membrane protein